MNDTKGKTLEEISKIVTDINFALKQRKEKLAPQIKELRSVRSKYQELEREYLDKKAVYDNTAAGLESERVNLEQECDEYQEECLRVESRYHYLNCLNGIADVHIKRVEEELEFSKGKGRLLRDFKCYKDLYQSKIQQQELLSKELRRRQKMLRESASQHSEQRQMFVDLRNFLDIKHRVRKQLAAASHGADGGVMSFGAPGNETGGANIMKIEQGM